MTMRVKERIKDCIIGSLLILALVPVCYLIIIFMISMVQWMIDEVLLSSFFDVFFAISFFLIALYFFLWCVPVIGFGILRYFHYPGVMLVVGNFFIKLELTRVYGFRSFLTATATAYFYKKDYKSAINILEHGIENSPRFVDYYLNLAINYYYRGL